MRIAVVDSRAIQLMPCTPAKARHLLKAGKAKPKRDKLGMFYVQLCYEQEPTNQPLVVGIDPGSKFEGLSVVGSKAVEVRRTMRRARRFRKWRRPKRFANRLRRKPRLPPSTRSRWEAKGRIVMHLKKTLPLTEAVVEDVQAVTRPGKAGKWNASFSPVQVGKEHLYHLLRERGLGVHLREGWQTKALRDYFGLNKTDSKSKPSFESHSVDSWVLAASLSGAEQPTSTQLWYLVPAVLHRRQLHRRQAAKGGIRKPYGGTRSLGVKRGTLVRHPTYGLCTVGGCDRSRGTVSIHAHRSNARLTQGAYRNHCFVLTFVAWRSWVVKASVTQKKGAGVSSRRLNAGGPPRPVV
jgi:RRXRR protein